MRRNLLGPLTLSESSQRMWSNTLNSESSPDVTGLLRAWGQGDRDAGDRLVPLVYKQLRRRAAAYLRQERPNHTLQALSLIHI